MALTAVVVMALVLWLNPTVAEASPASEQIGALLGLPGQGAPLGPDQSSLTGLQSPDPGARVSLIDPPKANNQGSARLSYPIEVPAGRNDSQPDLSINYDSTSADGWLGLGWDLSAEAIAVDTRWGAPRYDAKRETESYDFDGNELTPLAHATYKDLPLRKKNRHFHERIEGKFYTIIRHGDSPSSYWWEVVNQEGTHFYFGATLAYNEKHELTGTLDRSQVLTDASNSKHIYKWPLTAVEDFNGNVTTYHYTMVHDPVTSHTSVKGSQLYLSRIEYDRHVTKDEIEPGPYAVTFDLTRYLKGTSPRPDVITDARGGGLQVTARLLHRITVSYQGKTIRSYKLTYAQGEFHKTLLQKITQYDSAGKKFNEHTFTYYDNIKANDATKPDESYDGFAKSSQWSTGDDHVKNSAIGGLQEPSALSGAYSNSYDGHIYLGFNPLAPSKDGSVGVTVDYNHVDAYDTLAMVDINGDGLPDKVFEENGGVHYRLNRSGPDGNTTFGPAHDVTGINGLPQQSSNSVGVGPEAHIGVSVLYNHTWTFTKSSVYFIDVNNDGLPDLVNDGTVYYDHLVDGKPKFTTDSSKTLVPIGASQVDAKALLPQLKKIYEQELAASPLVDSIRRWVAPYSGTVSISGAVSMADPAPASYGTADGVTVAIQHNGTQLWSHHLGAHDTTAVSPPSADVDSITVQAGDRIYFRVESGYDGKYDAVNWSPTISYTHRPTATDANGLSVSTFDATKDFTAAGRPNMRVIMPYDGTIALDSLLHKTAATSDDVTLQVLDAGTADKQLDPPKVLFSKTLLADKTGTITPPASLKVTKGEMLELHVATGSRIDLSDIHWEPSLYYTGGTDQHGKPLKIKDKDGKYLIRLNPPYSTDVYPRSSIAAPDTGSDLSKGSHTVLPSTPATVSATSHLTKGAPTALDGHPTGTIVFTVKTTDRLLGKETMTIADGLVTACTVEDLSDGSSSACTHNGTTGWAPLTFSLPAETTVFYDFSILHPVLADDIQAGAADGKAVPVHGTYNPNNSTQDTITGKGLYAQPYRGWAATSYNGGDRSDGNAMDESRLVIDRSDYPRKDHYYHPDLGNPEAQQKDNTNTHPYPSKKKFPSNGFVGAAGDANPMDAHAWPLAPSPAHLDTLQNPPAQVPDQWLGSKNEVWVRAGTMSSARLSQDYVQVPTEASYAGASAVAQTSETQQDAIAADLLGLGGSYSWGHSDGLVDELDMNGDGFPDVIGNGTIQYTNSVGSLDTDATSEPGLATNGMEGSGSARETHSSAWSLGLSGNAAKFSADAKGSTNAPQQAQPSSGTTKKANSSGSGAAEAEPEGAGKRSASSARPASADSAAASSESESESEESPAGSSAANRRGSSASGAEPDGDAPETDSDEGSKLSLGVSGQYAKGSSNHTDDHQVGGKLVDTDLIDVNGDGLPDRVSSYTNGRMKVAFNLGYSFAAPVLWSPNAVTQKGSSASVNGGVNIGFNDGMFGIGGGVAGGYEADQDDGVLSDINGDGLADYLTDKDGQLYAAINTGDGFATPVIWHGAASSKPVDGVDSQIATSTTANLGGGAYFTIGIPVCVLPDFEPACYIIINPGFDYSRSMSRQELELRDINGDGYLDDLSSSPDNTTDVRLNNTGDTNLLKSVDRPMGGSFTIDYERKGNTTAAPASTWAMSKVTVHDNTPAPSADTQVTTYSYSGNFYNREERQGYGYSTVTERQVDPSGATYRQIVQNYANDNYYDHGLLTSQTVEDGSHAVQTRTTNSYTLRNVATGKAVTSEQAQHMGLATVFPELSTTTREYYWGNDKPGKTTTATYTYGERGNPIKITDAGDGSKDALTATIRYSNCPDSNVFNVPTHVVESNSVGKTLREETSDVPCDIGAPVKISQHLADGSTADTEISYDDYFNIKSITSPPNSNGQAYKVRYWYDPQTHTYVSKTKDSFNYISTATYDPMFGTVASTTDVNGNTTSYAYDTVGRLISVVGPDQQGTGRKTLTFEYHPGTSMSWAASHAIDTLHGGTLDTVRFADGLDRTVQTKHDATVSTGPTTRPKEVMVVSGRIVFDFLGRVVEQYLPTTEDLGTPHTFNSGFDVVTPARSSYDVLDRLVTYVKPNTAKTTWAYGFGKDRSGDMMFQATKTDALKHKTLTFTDVRQNVRSIDMVDGDRNVWTSYRHNPLGKLTGITDDHGNITSMTYDQLGRQTSIDSPDSGRTTMKYDLASNLIGKQTANLLAQKRPPSITYDYNFNHLTSIHYPDSPAIDVSYTYGGPGSAHNAAGQVTKVVDQAGSQAYEYGKLGHVTRETDTVYPIHAQPLATYTTSFDYDTWGRLHTLVYPDGEKLTYSYGFGGLSSGVSGVKGSHSYPYVTSMQYDKFGHQTIQDDGNGTVTQYAYSPTTQRLNLIRSGNPTRQFQNQTYTYDLMGNLTDEKNQVKVASPSQYGGPSSQHFTYDDLYRLTGASGTYHYAPDDTRTYKLKLGYDSLGDIVSNSQTDTITRPGGASQHQAATTHDWTYSYRSSQPNAVHHLSGPGTLPGRSNGKGSGHSPSTGATYSYDKNGNQTGWKADRGGQRRTIVWDDANRIQSIANNGQTTRFRYDAQGNRIVRYGPGGVTTTVNKYYTVINGSHPVKNIFLGSQRIAQQAVASGDTRENDEYFYHRDLTGSTAYVTDSSGKVFQHLEYLATGAPWVDEVSNPHVIDYLYTSHPYSSVTQLSYYGARYLDPTLNQFMSPDPAMSPSPQAAVTDPMLLQPYSYVDNNPMSYVDPDGRANTSVQQQNQHRAPTTPRQLDTIGKGKNGISKSYLKRLPMVKLPGKPASRKKVLKIYKKIAAPDVPPLIGVSLKSGKVNVKIVGINPKKLRR